jgi:uncharacterized protein YkwD
LNTDYARITLEMVLATRQKRPTSIHHKKRHGQHHKVTKTYTKTYWPYLPLILIVVLGISVNSIWGKSHTGVLGYSTDMSISELLTGTNAQRASNSEAPLNLNSELDSAAQAKANDMVAKDYWSHVTPSGQQPWVFITAAGYNYVAAGENLAYGFDTSQDVIAGWMGSPEHRANILDSSYQDVGFGFANSPDFQSNGPETVVVAEYAEPASQPPPAQVTTTPAKPATSTPTVSPPPSTPQPATSTPTTPTQQSTITATTPKSTPSTEVVKSTTVPTISLNDKPVSRLELMTKSQSSWSVFAISALSTICIALFLLRHGLIWRRVIRKGEKFAIRYHVLDIILISVGVAGYVVTRNAGVIH